MEVNTRACELTGHSREELEGRALQSLFDVEERNRPLNAKVLAREV